MDDFRVRAVPDVILPDGSVHPGELGRLVLLEHREAVWAEVVRMMGPGFKPADCARWDMLQAALKELDQRLARTL